MHAVKAYLPPLARLLMSSLFIWDGILQLRDPSGTAKYLAAVHVPIPDVAIWISIVVHLLGGLGILVGFKIRWAAAALVLFCLGTGFGVHLPAGDIDNMIHFYKNLVMAGGFLYVMTYGAGVMSIDGADKAQLAFTSKLTFNFKIWPKEDIGLKMIRRLVRHFIGESLAWMPG